MIIAVRVKSIPINIDLITGKADLVAEIVNPIAKRAVFIVVRVKSIAKNIDLIARKADLIAEIAILIA
ncbi:MAG: hypothetical protein ACK4TA_23650 [Saprospiraceae bacterium]